MNHVLSFKRDGLLLLLLLFLLLPLDNVAATDGGCNGEEDATDFENYVWEEINAGPRWEARAGLQVVELNDTWYLLGGRTPRPIVDGNVIPGDSDIYNDVWISEDHGETWRQVLENGGEHWAPRGYFKAVTKDGYMYVIGGQDYEVQALPICSFLFWLPPSACPRFVSNSNFFNDVWRSRDGVNWEVMTAAAPWAGRAGLSVAVLNEEIYVLGGSTNDDNVFTGGPPQRIYYNDVWKSSDGREWELLTDNAAFSPRAGGVVVVKEDYIYVLGGEEGFICDPLPDCELPYYNDVWRSSDGVNWELVTGNADWSPRPGHACGVLQGEFVCFGGFGEPLNPIDVWVSEDAVEWTLLSQPPWNAESSEEIKYDFDTIVTEDAIYTFGGDRETFDFFDPDNYLRIDDDIWKFSLNCTVPPQLPPSTN